MAHQCPLEDRHKFEKITKLVEENILFKLSYAFFSPRSIYFCEKNSFIAILGTLKLKIKITDVSVSGHVFSLMLFFTRIIFFNVMNTYYKQKNCQFLLLKVKLRFFLSCLNTPILVKFKTVKGCQGNLCRADARPGEGSLSTVLNLTKIGELRNKN